MQPTVVPCGPEAPSPHKPLPLPPAKPPLRARLRLIRRFASAISGSSENRRPGTRSSIALLSLAPYGASSRLTQNESVQAAAAVISNAVVELDKTRVVRARGDGELIEAVGVGLRSGRAGVESASR